MQQRTSGHRHKFSGHKPLITFFSDQIEKELKCCSPPPSPPIPFANPSAFTWLIWYFEKVIWRKGTQKLLCPPPLKTFLAYQWRNQEATLPLPCYNSCKACDPPTNITQSTAALPFPSPPKTFLSYQTRNQDTAQLAPPHSKLSSHIRGKEVCCPAPPHNHFYVLQQNQDQEKPREHTPEPEVKDKDLYYFATINNTCNIYNTFICKQNCKYVNTNVN